MTESEGRYRDYARRLAGRRHRRRREHGLGVERIALVRRSGDRTPLLWDLQSGDHRRRRRRRSVRGDRAHHGAASVRRRRASAEPDAGAVAVVIGEGSASGAGADAPAVATRGTTDNGIETAASTFGLATRRSSAPPTAPARSACRGGRARATAGDHPLSVSDAVTAGIAVTAIAIAHGRRARWLATGRGHDSVRSDDASSANRGRLTAAALGRQRGARALHARAAAAAGDSGARLDRGSGLSDGTAV